MPDFGAWLDNDAAIASGRRAALAWRRIQDKPTSLTFRKPDGTTLAAQTVRVEYDNSVSEPQSEAGPGATRKLVIFGVRNHDTVTDTDVKSGYRFVLNGKAHTVIDVVETIGEVQATAEAVT